MAAPVHRMKKREIVWLSRNLCKAHSTNFLSHWGCYEKEYLKGKRFNPGENIPINIREGFFDIESSGFQATFSIMICYCIKDGDSDKIYERIATKKELSSSLDKKVVEQCVKDLKNFDRIISFYGCVTPGQRILTADLRWIPVESLSIGDKLLSFDEESGEFWHKRKFAESTVVHNIPIQKEIFEIKLEDGTILEASGDHPWLVKRNEGSSTKYKSGYWKFRKTTELQHFNCKIPSMIRIMPTWDTLKTYEAGYVSAFIDGEGGIGQSRRSEGGIKRNDYMLSVTASQNKGEVLDRYLSALDSIGYLGSVSQYDPSNKKCRAIQVTGGKHNMLKFLGQVRPQKLSRLNIDRLGIIHQYGEKIPIVSIKPKGIGTVMGLGVSNGTYIVEGFGSHNSRFDLPFLRSRAVYWEIPFPHYHDLLHTDVYYIIRNKFKLHRNSLESACNFLLPEKVQENHPKSHWGKDHWVWAIQGKKESLDYIIQHCRNDVKMLEDLYYVVMDYTQRRDTSI